MPQAEPGTLCQGLIVPSIGSRDVACCEGPDVGGLEHFLKLLDFIDNAFKVHSANSIANQLVQPEFSRNVLPAGRFDPALLITLN